MQQEDKFAKWKEMDVTSLKGNPEERFVPKKKYNDLWAAILFILHFLVLAGIAVGGFSVGIIYHDDTTTVPPPPSYYGDDSFNGSIYVQSGLPLTYSITITISVVLCGVVGALFGGLWLWLMKKFPKQMILSGIVFSAVLVTITAIITIILGVLVFSIVLIAIGGLLLLLNFVFLGFFFCWRKRIEFSAQLLAAIVGILQEFKGTFFVSAVGVVAYSIWFFFWILFLLAIQQYVYISPYIAGTFIIFALFSWFWTCQVIKNVVHTTITGTVGMWYFRDSHDMPNDVVKGSLIRACTTSFGSICFGSLLVAIVTTIRVLAESGARSRNNNIFVRLFCCFVACILRVLEDLLNYFNTYAYTFISIYGEPYLPSAKRAFKLFAHYGIDAIFNDSLIGSVIGMGCFLGAMLSALVALGIAFFFEVIDIADATAVGLSFILGFLTGYGIILICLETVNCAVVGLFVSVCEEPHRLKEKIPALWDAIHVRYNTCCSNLFSHV